MSDAPQIDLCKGANSFLEEVYSEKLALFPYSTSVESGAYVNDFRLQESIRYTINTLLGLQEASRATGRPEATRLTSLVDSFLESRYADVTSYADLGLLLVLMRDRLRDPRASEALRRIEQAIAAGTVRKLEMQSLAWMLWGLTTAARAGDGTAEKFARELFEVMRDGLVAPGTLLPRHSRSFHRRRLVSFGATVYFLRAMHEYATLSDDQTARSLFESGVRRLLEIQGPSGEWPWLIDPDSGRVVDMYPVFAVHQDSMAPLFLLPALDEGLPGVLDALKKGFAWALGQNELGILMYEDGPFRAYRSIERTDPLPRALRYARALTNVALGRSGSVAEGRRLRLNSECRSYHLGWILYAWSGRQELLGDIARRSGDDLVRSADTSAA